MYDELPENGPDSPAANAPGERADSGGGAEADELAGLAFEEAFARLEHIVGKLEGGQASLEESLRLFEEGVGLARLCRSRLERAERRIRVLVEGREGDAERRIADALEKEVAGSGDGR